MSSFTLRIHNGVLVQRDEATGAEQTADVAAILSQMDTGGFVLDTDSRLVTLTKLGDLAYGGASGVATRLAGQTTTTKKVLTQTGTGSASAAPAWGTLDATDVGASASNHNHDTAYVAKTAATHIADPAEGTTVDAEARAAIASILDILEARGLMAAAE